MAGRTRKLTGRRVWALAAVAAAGSAVWGAGDSIGPPQPQTTVKSAAPTAPAAGAPAAAGTPAAAGKVWSLLDCVEEALVNSPEIGAARGELRGARGQILEAQAAGKPSLSASYANVLEQGDKTPNGLGGYTIVQQPDFQVAEVDVNWLVFSGGALTANEAIAKYAQVAARHALDTSVNTVIGNTVQAYLELLKSTELKRVADHTVELATEQVRIAQASFDAGAVPKVNVLRAQTELQNALQNQLQAANAIDLAQSTLLQQMGHHQGEAIVAAPMPRVLAQTPDLGESLKLAVRQRPELKAQQASIKIDEQAIKAARAGYYPSLAVGGKYQYNDNPPTSGLYSNWSLNAALSLNLWDWNRTTGKIVEAQGALNADRNRLEAAMRGIELDVRRSLLTMSDARKRIDVSQAEVESATEALKVEQLRYTTGEGIYLDWLDARRALSQAETDLVNAYYDDALAEAAWLAATGSYVNAGAMHLPATAATPVPAATVPASGALRPGTDLDQLDRDYGVNNAAPAKTAAPAPPAVPKKP